MDLSNYLLLIAGAVLPSLAIAWAMGFVVRHNAPQWGLMDRPTAGHKGHSTPTPLGGGLAIAAGIILPFVVGQVLLVRLSTSVGLFGLEIPEFVRMHIPGAWSQTAKLWTVIAAATALMVTGLIDDARGLPWQLRLAIHVVVASFVVWAWDWGMTIFIPWQAATYVMSVLWIVALINAFNMLDNMDGLSAGVAAICSAILAAGMLIAPDPQTGAPQLFVAGFLLVLLGSVLGFLWHNRPPARLFMGDAGSYFIGFCLAMATMQATYTGYESGARHAVLAPLCIMAVPLYDILSVIVIRLGEGRSPFHADRRHLSHRLVDLGFSKPQAVLIIYLMTAVTGLGGLALHQVGLTVAVFVFVLVGCVLGIVALLEIAAARRRK